MEQTDLSKLKYANCPPWIELSKETRFVAEGAKNIGADTPAVKDAAVNIRAVADDLKRGKRYPELIGVDDQNGYIILMEATHVPGIRTCATARADRMHCRFFAHDDNLEVLLAAPARLHPSNPTQNW